MLPTIEKPIITSFRISYAVGFSDSLSLKSWNGRQDMARYEFEKEDERKLHKAYLRGWKLGYKIRTEVRREMHAAGVIFAD